MGDGVNIASRLEGIAQAGAICLSEDAYRRVKLRLDLAVNDLGETQLKNIAEPVRVYALEAGKPAGEADQARRAKAASNVRGSERGDRRTHRHCGGSWYFLGANRPATVISNAPTEAAHLSIVVLPFTNLSGDPKPGLFRGRHHGEPHDRPVAHPQQLCHRAQYRFNKGKNVDSKEISKQLGVRYVLEGSVQRDQTMCASTRNLLMARPARISGPSPFSVGTRLAGARS